VNDTRQKRLGEALRENLKRRKQQAKGRAGRAEQDRTAQPAPSSVADEDTGVPVGNEDKRD
jgi:hypothetical protein